MMIPGEYIISNRPIIANQGKKTITIEVANTGDRPVQVGSHTHFFEVNKNLSFDREQAYGFHLNIPAGTSLRFEPGDQRKVELTEFSGKKIVYGLSALVNGPLNEKKSEALRKAKEQGFKQIS